MSPEEGASVEAGSTLHVLVDVGSPLNVRKVILFAQSNSRSGIVDAKEDGPFTFEMPIPRQLGPVVLKARLVMDDGSVQRIERTITITNSSALTSLEPMLPEVMFESAGESTVVTAKARYADGSLDIVDVTEGLTASLESDADTVAGLDAVGRLTARGNGHDVVRLEYKQVMTQMPVTVRFKPTPTTTPGPASTPTTISTTQPTDISTTNATPTPTIATMRPLFGKSLLLVGNVDPDKRALGVASSDPAIPNTGEIPDPRIVGAQLRVRTAVGCAQGPCDSVYTLPAAGWSLIGKPGKNKGYKFTDSKAVHGPIRNVLLKPQKLWKATGKGGSLGHDLISNPERVDVMLVVGNFAQCVRFGGEVKFASGRKSSKFTAKNATAPGQCNLSGH